MEPDDEGVSVAVNLTLPDGSVRSYDDGVTGADVAASIGSGLARAAVAVRVDGAAWDLSRPLPDGAEVAIITDSTDEGRHVMRHSAAHVMAQAVLDLYPGAAFAIGPPIEDGFYYDFDIGRGFVPEDLAAIEARMQEIIAEDQPFERAYLTKTEALEVFADQPFKREIIEGAEQTEGAGEDEVSIYRNLSFVDLCRGPHVLSTGRLKAVKLLRTSGSYWRGDERNPQLQRIYGTAWESSQALADYLHRIEEARKRDHRRLGTELDLYSFPAELGSGMAVWHPKGGMLRKVAEDYSRRLHQRFGFDFVFSPHLAREELWDTSGHLGFFAENMFPALEADEGERYRVKPMNCPFHVLIYKSRARSYRELPIRLSELGGVYRYEKSGVVHGLLRARGFTQDDSHVFCRREQLAAELILHIRFVLTLLRDFGFDEFEADLSTRNPDKWMGDLSLWEESTTVLAGALEAEGIPFKVAEGEAAFYGPKIDVHVRDAIGRRWQCSTIQVDMNEPERFGLEFTNAANEREQPVMIHCAKFGSVERFLGVLVEHYAGAFPGWLSPVQAVIVPVADRHDDYARSVQEALGAAELRVEVDLADDTVGEKIRRAITAKSPAILVVGDRDVEAGTVGLRLRGDDSERRGVPLDGAVAELTALCAPPP